MYLSFLQWRGTLLFDLHTALYWKANKKYAMIHSNKTNKSFGQDISEEKNDVSRHYNVTVNSKLIKQMKYLYILRTIAG